jgi:Ca2+-binding RTX toxin-like protein
MTTVRLTNRNDVYTTQEGDREVFALRGDDRITVEGLFRGDGATDFLDVHGGPGDDRILGIRHDTQLLFGDRGNDYIEVGHAVEDSLADGGPGNDVLRSLGGEGQGTSLRGGTGDDRLFGSLDEGLTTLDGGPGRDLLTGGAGDEGTASTPSSPTPRKRPTATWSGASRTAGTGSRRASTASRSATRT